MDLGTQEFITDDMVLAWNNLQELWNSSYTGHSIGFWNYEHGREWFLTARITHQHTFSTDNRPLLSENLENIYIDDMNLNFI